MDKVDELRKKLKEDAASQRAANTIDTSTDGPSVSAASSDIERYTPNIPNQDGYSVQPVSRPGLGTVGISRAIGNFERELTDLTRSSAQDNSGKRRTDGRPSENNRQDRSNGIDVSASLERASSGSEQVRKVGNLETDEPIPPRYFDAEREAAIEKSETQGIAPARKRGRPPKQRDIGPLQEVKPSYGTPTVDAFNEERQRKNFFTTGKTLSKAEAKELLDPLTSALKDELKQIDKLLWQYTGDVLEQPIWSDTTDTEMDHLTSLILKLGQKSPTIATVARGAVDASDYIVAGSVIGPRFMKTVEVIRTARKSKQSETRNRQSTLERFRQRRKQVTGNPVQPGD